MNALISRDDKAAGRFARAATAVVRNGVPGRVLRRYSVGQTRWLLVVTEDGAQLSWPEAETCAAAPVENRRALHVRQPSELRTGDRVVDQHGLQGTVVGFGANGTRVVIKWDDGSTSNLSATDLDRWGLIHQSPTVHARGGRSTPARVPRIAVAPADSLRRGGTGGR